MIVCAIGAGAETDPRQTGFSSGVELPQSGDPATTTSSQRTQPENVSDKRWWRRPGAAATLEIESVGGILDPFNGEPAIVVECNSPFARDIPLDEHLAVYDPATLEQVAGSWRLGSNSRRAYFTVSKAGRYIVRIRAGLRDRHGHTLNTSLSGPVRIPADQSP